MDYAKAGVDTAAGDRAVALMAGAVRATHGPEVLSGGGFAGLFDAGALAALREPVLATCTDGVGTKIEIAKALGVHTTIGQDLVAMVVDDLVVTGARPLFMTDYIACGKVIPERIAEIVSGIAAACQATGTALIGGETAEHPGTMAPEDYDIAGAATGVAERSQLRGAHRVGVGDAVVALASSGLHSNGYSLVRRIVRDAGLDLLAPVAEFGRTLGEELLEPTALYARDCLALLPSVNAYAHVTGGGLAANASRVIPPGCTALIERGTIAPPPVFRFLQQVGEVSDTAAEDTFNMGVGMVAVVPAGGADSLVVAARERGREAWVIGEVRAAGEEYAGGRVTRGAKGENAGSVALVGRYR